MPDRDCFNASGDVSTQNVKDLRWPKKRTIWSCEAAKGPLFTRWYLFECKQFSIYVHCFHMSSGYFEHTSSGRAWIPRFSIIKRPAEWAHRVEVIKPTWTFVIRGPWVREWGFWPDNK